MKKNINLKNNKGISLITVIVTLILMTIILTSIVYSNNRTNEIKKAMLLNSDIEELTKKVEMYYLEREKLPIDETEGYCYTEGSVNGSESVYYYRIDTSLLENLNLNNKEKLDEQWYVMNEETHTIYFVKREGGTIRPQIAQYSNDYDNIIGLADTSIDFNKDSRRRSRWRRKC